MSALATTLPDAGGVVQIGTSIESGIRALTQAVGAMQDGGAGSPLVSLTGALGGLKLKVTVDTDKLTNGLPQALTTMGHAMTPSGLEFIQTLSQDFDAARALLAESGLARAVADGKSLQEVALAAVADALTAFDTRRTELLTRLLPTEAVADIGNLLTQLDQLASDYESHKALLLPFVSRYMLGHGPDLLAPALAHVRQALAVLDAWAPASVQAQIDAPLAALRLAMRELLDQIASFDPRTEASYDALDQMLDAVQAALPPLCRAMTTLYASARTAIEAPAWDQIFAGYATALDALPLDDTPVAADAVHALGSVLEGLLGRLEAQLTPADLAVKIRALSGALHAVFEQSPVGQVRGAIRDFLERIVAGIQAIPTDKISDTVHAMLGQVGAQVQQLGLAQAGDQIEAAFQAVESFIEEHLNDALATQVGQALQALLDQLDALPIATLVDNVNQLIAQLTQALGQLQATLNDALAQLSDLAAQLDELSFKPVGDAVVTEIDALRAKLAEINPNALSEVEKIALQAALAVVRAVDLQGVVEREVKQGFGVARAAALDGLERVTGVLEGVKQQVDQFSPQRLVQELLSILDQATQTVAQLDGRRVMQPLYGELDQLASLLGAARPGALLDPLQAPYQTVMGGVEQLDPDRLVAPLNGIYARVHELIDKVNVVPVLEELDRREKALLTEVRQSIIAGLEALQLPPPLDAFYAQVRPVLEGLTEALLADPSVELRRIGLDLSTRFKPSDLLAPLDQVHGRLVEMLRGVPAADLEAAFNALRVGLGQGLPAIDPQRLTLALRGGRGELANCSPRLLLGSVLQTPAWQARFELRVADVPLNLQVRVAGTRSRLDALAALVEGPATLVNLLIAEHDALDQALGRRITALDASAAQASYARVAANLRRLLPEFLYAPRPLTQEDILTGLRALQPTAQAGALDELFHRFQARVRSMQDVLDPAFADFFNTLREPLQMLSPLAIKDDVAAVYAALDAKVQLIDPAVLAADLRTAIYAPVHDALQAIDPARLAQRLDQAYQRALGALTGNVKALLDRIATALDVQLQRLKAAVQLIAGSIEEAFLQAAHIFDGLIDGLENLVFVEIMERLKTLVRTLGVSFDREVDRVLSAFDQMLGAIPLGGGAVSLEVSR